MKEKSAVDQSNLQYCRKCLRKLSKKSDRRFQLARELLHSLADEDSKPQAHGCFDICPKKGLVVKYLGNKVTMKL